MGAGQVAKNLGNMVKVAQRRRGYLKEMLEKGSNNGVSSIESSFVESLSSTAKDFIYAKQVTHATASNAKYIEKKCEEKGSYSSSVIDDIYRGSSLNRSDLIQSLQFKDALNRWGKDGPKKLVRIFNDDTREVARKHRDILESVIPDNSGQRSR